MQCGEEPGFDLREITQLVALLDPNVESILSEVPRVRLRPRQTHCEPIERLVVLTNNRFKESI